MNGVNYLKKVYQDRFAFDGGDLGEVYIAEKKRLKSFMESYKESECFSRDVFAAASLAHFDIRAKLASRQIKKSRWKLEGFESKGICRVRSWPVDF